MKKIFDTKTIITFIISGILFGSIGVYAASYYAKDVSYQSSDASWEVSNVNDALNELYQNISNGNAYIFTHNTSNGTHSYTVEKNMKNGLIFINDIRSGYSVISINGVEVESERITTSDRNGYMVLGQLNAGDVITVKWSGTSPVAGYYTWIIVDAIPNKID